LDRPQRLLGRKAGRRRLPPRAEHAKDAAAAKIRGAASATGKSIANLTPQPVKDAGGLVVDRALDPALQAALGLLEWVTETVQRFSDPADIYKHDWAQGRQVTTLAHLEALDLEDLDGFTRWFAWQCRTTGVFEGAGMGLLTFIPVAGSVAAIGLDLVVLHAVHRNRDTRRSRLRPRPDHHRLRARAFRPYAPECLDRSGPESRRRERCEGRLRRRGSQSPLERKVPQRPPHRQGLRNSGLSGDIVQGHPT
jgi:hypothetical protein